MSPLEKRNLIESYLSLGSTISALKILRSQAYQDKDEVKYLQFDMDIGEMASFFLNTREKVDKIFGKPEGYHQS